MTAQERDTVARIFVAQEHREAEERGAVGWLPDPAHGPAAPTILPHPGEEAEDHEAGA